MMTPIQCFNNLDTSKIFCALPLGSCGHRLCLVPYPPPRITYVFRSSLFYPTNDAVHCCRIRLFLS